MPLLEHSAPRWSHLRSALRNSACCCLAACSSVPPDRSPEPEPVLAPALAAEVRVYTAFLFGTRFELRLAGSDGRGLDLAAEAAFEEGARIEALASVWTPDSAVARFNAAADEAGRHRVAAELAELVGRCVAFCAASEGAFDPTVGALLESNGYYSGGGSTPSAVELAAARERVGCDRVRVEGDFLITSVSGVRLDLGGVAKGWAVDHMAALLRASGVDHGLLSGGGSAVLAWGEEPGERGWPFEIDPGTGPETWRLVDCAVAVSGQLSEPVFLDGRLVSHIIDPRTGRSVDHSTLRSIARADTATLADLASTALLVLGSEAAVAWLDDAQRLPGLQAIWLTDVAPDAQRGSAGRALVRLRAARERD